MSKNINLIISVIVIFLTSSFFLISKIKSATVTVTAIIPGVCGNGIKEIGEQCDGRDFGGQTCFNFGYSGGSLSCNINCTLNFSGCTLSSGGGGGGIGPIPSYGTIIISGYAQPKSEVTLMSDGEIKATTKASDDAKFSFTLSNLSPGNYLFTLYSEDKDGRRSTLYTFPVFIRAGETITAGNILLSPTIDVDKLEVKKGDFISIFGFTVPESNVLINVSSEEEYFFRTNANKDGFYLYQLGTDILDLGDHNAKSKSILGNQLVSNFSRVVTFKVGAKTVEKKIVKCPKVDLNNDCRVNLVDFSILAYWYKRKLSPAFLKIEKEKFNGDGKVDLIDFSILAYWWTG